jgi:hypothetical protein
MPRKPRYKAVTSMLSGRFTKEARKNLYQKDKEASQVARDYFMFEKSRDGYNNQK